MAHRSADPLLRGAEKGEPFDLCPHLPLQNPVIPSLIDASGQKDYGGREAHQGLEHGPNVGAFGIVIEPYATLLADKFKAVLKARKYFDHSLDGQCRSEEHTSELQSQSNLVCRLLLEKKINNPSQAKGDARGLFAVSAFCGEMYC